MVLDLPEHGYAGTRIEEIAARVEVAPVSVYEHFGSKRAWAQALAGRLRGARGPRLGAASVDGVIAISMRRGRHDSAGPAPAAGLRALVKCLAAPASLTRERRLCARYGRAIQRAVRDHGDRAAA